jgi:uncharacterized membrane protein YbaN (DUF454 family)
MPGGARCGIREHCRVRPGVPLPEPMVRPLYLTLGIVSFATGFVGMFLPLVPTVPLMLLAAFCFARSNPAWERRLLDDPRFGPSIRAWRARRAIPRSAKLLSTVLLLASAATSLVVLDGGWQFVTPVLAVVMLPWIWTRPD